MSEKFEVKVEGHIKPLFCWLGPQTCGLIKDGVGFEFGNEGGWVISLHELQHIVARAELAHQQVQEIAAERPKRVEEL